MGFPRLTSRHALLAVFAAATFVVMALGALASIAMLRTSLYGLAEAEARQEARVVSDMGLAAALSHGSLSRRDLKLAAAQYAAARRDLPLSGVVIWLPSGRAVFALGSGRADAAAHESSIVRAALTSGTARVVNATDPHVGPILEAAVPLGPGALGAIVEFHFTQSGIEQALHAAKWRLYALTGIGALIMYLAILPLLARLSKRLPLPVDPFRRAAQAELASALTRGELVLHYQPKTELQSGRIVGAEALVRWEHPRRGLLGPCEFLPVAESSSELMKLLTSFVLESAIGDCAGWLRSGYALPVAVNVAPAVLLDGDLATLAAEALDRYGVSAGLLVLELTESALMQPEEDVTVHLDALRDLGISLSIDDFGTGNSSLSRLRSLPLDELKIDRSFVSGIARDERDLSITRHIIHLGLELGLRVVAEGVEDERTLRLLLTLGCEIAQGFHLARPMPEEELRRWLRGRDLAVSAL